MRMVGLRLRLSGDNTVLTFYNIDHILTVQFVEKGSIVNFVGVKDALPFNDGPETFKKAGVIFL